MKRLFTTLMTAGLTTSVLGIAVAPPASAQLLENIGIGAAAGSATGIVIGDGSGFDDAINGAAAGAAVSVLGSDGEGSNALIRDVTVGAIAGGLAGTLTNDDSFLENALQGAAAGAAVSTFGESDGRLGRELLGRTELDEALLGRGSDILGRGGIFGRDDDNDRRGGIGETLLGRGSLGRDILLGRGGIGRRVLGGVLGRIF